MDKGRGHHSDRSNDRGDHFSRREDDRGDHSHSHRQEHGGREWRDERKHHSKGRKYTCSPKILLFFLEN